MFVRYEKDFHSYKQYRGFTSFEGLMFSHVTACCALLAITSCSFAQTETMPPGMQEVIRDLDRAATEAVKNPSDTGYTLGVVTRNGLAWTKSYGFADSVRTRRPASTRNTPLERAPLPPSCCCSWCGMARRIFRTQRKSMYPN